MMISASNFSQLVEQSSVIPVYFCNEHLLLDAEGVLYWPSHDALLFSDLHFEKGSFLSQFSQNIPQVDTCDTLLRMQAMIYRCRPSSVICPGDSFHDTKARNRMRKVDSLALNRMVDRVNRWIWVLGNHDPEIPDTICGLRMKHTTLSDILLTHEPLAPVDQFSQIGQIIGHFHPKISTKLPTQKVTGKCFVVASDLLIMPSFGTFTGGLSVKDESINMLVCQQSTKYYLSFSKKIYML